MTTVALNPESLLREHVSLQLGTFFTGEDHLGEELRYVYSAAIPDFYWNFGFGLTGRVETCAHSVAALREAARRHSRQPVLYVTPETRPQNIGDILRTSTRSKEAWMTARRDQLHAGDHGTLAIRGVGAGASMDDFIRVFRDAYGEPAHDEVGYTGLSPAYIDAVRDSTPSSGVRATHLVGYVGDEAQAIASVFARGRYGGLYSVGTVHGARRQGFGAAISYAACMTAFNDGAELIFLQTEPDSPVEAMYARMGFAGAFLGEFLVLE